MGSSFSIECSFTDEPTRFEGHFPSKIVIPGAALVDRVVREIEGIAVRSITGLKQVKFVRAASPTAVLILTGIVAESTVRFELHAQAHLICAGTLVLGSVT